MTFIIDNIDIEINNYNSSEKLKIEEKEKNLRKKILAFLKEYYKINNNDTFYDSILSDQKFIRTEKSHISRNVDNSNNIVIVKFI